MRHKILLSTLLLLGFITHSAWSLSDNPLTFTTELPKNLFSAPTAILISTEDYFSGNLENKTEIASYEGIAARLQQDSKRLGLLTVHLARHSSLDSHPLAVTYRQLQVENLLILHLLQDQRTGSTSLLLLLTSFNGQESLLTPWQKAFSLEARSYENLMRLFANQVAELPPSYFQKAPPKNRVVTTGSHRSRDAAAPYLSQAPAGTENRTSLGRPSPEITLLLQEGQHGRAGGQHSFFYTRGGSDDLNAGFWGQKIRKDLVSSPEALVHLNKYRNAKTAFLLNRLIFYSSVLAYSIELGNARGYFTDRQKIYVGVAAASSGIRLLMNRNTNGHMRRAVEEYNEFVRPQGIQALGFLSPDQLHLGLMQGGSTRPSLTLTWSLSRIP